MKTIIQKKEKPNVIANIESDKYYYHGKFTINIDKNIDKSIVKQLATNYNNYDVHILTKSGSGFNKSLIIYSDDNFKKLKLKKLKN